MQTGSRASCVWPQEQRCPSCLPPIRRSDTSSGGPGRRAAPSSDFVKIRFMLCIEAGGTRNQRQSRAAIRSAELCNPPEPRALREPCALSLGQMAHGQFVKPRIDRI